METIEIKLLDLYHEKILFTQLRTGKGGEIKLTINNKFEFAKSNDLKNLKTTILTTIKDDDMSCPHCLTLWRRVSALCLQWYCLPA